MRYKVIGDVNISGNVKGDFLEAEAHAMTEYLNKGQVEVVQPAPAKPAKVAVKKPAKVAVKKK